MSHPACTPASRSPSAKPATNPAPNGSFSDREAPAPRAGPGRERTSLDHGFRFALGHATDRERDFGYGLSYFSDLAKAGYGDGPADPNFDDRGFRELDLPHDWAVELPFDAKGSHSHGYKALGRGFPENSVGWYRRELDITEADRGRHIALEFDGVFRDSRVWVNGFLVGREPSGYASFQYDVSDYLNYGGRNVLSVRVDASREEGWFYEGAGIYRHVWLTKTAPVHVAYNGTFVTSTVKDSVAGVVAHAKIVTQRGADADAEVRFEVVAPDGTVVAHASAGSAKITAGTQQEFVSDLTVKSPALWSLESPSLHELVTRVVVGGREVDRYVTRFGIRTVRFDPDRGFFLNGQHVFLKGTNNHQDHAGVGTALPDRLQEYRIERLKAMGSNAYRTAHHPPTPELLDACDRLGMLVIDENRSMGSSEQALADLERLIVRDRNHPSVILWSLGNEEWAIENDERGARIAQTMQKRANRLDPTRLTTVASSGAWNQGVGAVSEVMGYNYIMHGSTDEHHRQFPSQPGVGTEETTTQGTRGVYFTDEKLAHLAPLEEGSSGGNVEVGLKHYSARPYLAGIFYWTGFDYRGEPTPFEFPAQSSQFGILDTCGFPKQSFHYLQAWWREEPRLTLVPHWNFQGRDGQTIEVRAFSNLPQVELFLNGRSLGKKYVERYGHASWSVPYEAGTLSARGFVDGAVRLETRVETTTAPSELRLATDRSTLRADGRDLSVVSVSALDPEGRPVPTADALVEFTVEGGGRILGVGNGDPSSHEPDRYVRAVTTQPFVDFREHPAPRGEAPPELQPSFSDRHWNKAFLTPSPDSLIYRGTLTTGRAPEGSSLSLLVRPFGSSTRVYLNGRELAAFETSPEGRLPAIALSQGALRPGRNVLAVIATPFENDRARRRAMKVAPAVLRVEAPSPTWRRRLFNGLAQVLVQSSGQPGPIRLIATATGLSRAELTVQAAR